MDLDIIQSTKEGEITQFLCDVRDYFKASLATSEYENTSNVFYLTASDTTEQLLNRCECLLKRLKNKNPILPMKTTTTKTDCNTFSPSQTTIQTKNVQWHRICCDKDNNGEKNIDNEDVSYLDMSASHSSNDKKQTSDGINEDLNSFEDSDKTSRCSTFIVRQNKSFIHRLHDEADGNHQEDETNNAEDDARIYDICQVTSQRSDGEVDGVGLEEALKVIKQNFHISLPNINCPYLDLPAGHLSIKKSMKYGQLLKIEKRLFFDQSKKCYCGILNDWLLCYADGPTSNRPTISLYLKIPGIEIEHFGEGKRRDVCFQITSYDPEKRIVFQAINEIDAKEWIHAIESAIRSDITGIETRNSSTRKLPSPPVMKKFSFLSTFQEDTQLLSKATSNDCIYEEPSDIHPIVSKPSSEKRPELPHKQSNPLQLAHKYEYDVPKCPPPPFKDNSVNDVLLINPYENNETNSPAKTHTIILSDSLSRSSSPPSAQKLHLKMEENLDFQAKVKDVHSKLTSHLSSGPNIKKSLKKSLPSASPHDTESLSLPSPTSPLPDTSELKKQKKTSNSPQKNSNEKSSFAKTWFLNRLNKTTCSTRNNSASPSNSPSKCKQGEKENLLNSSSDVCEDYNIQLSNLGRNPVSPSLKSSSASTGSKVNMIINQLEANGHLAAIFNTDAVASFSSFCDNDVNNYEPIMTVSAPPTNVMKKV